MKPLVSILIPAYNAERWIGDTLRSALAQTWDCREIVVVNDGSTDRTLDVVHQFESGSVRVFSQPNRGAAATRNEAYRQSRGDFIQWLDADDLLAPDKIERQMAERRDERTLLSGAWGNFLYRSRRTQFAPSALWSDLSVTDWLVNKLSLNLHMQTATWLVSRALTEAAGPWNTQLLGDDDGEYFCRVLLASNGVHFVPESKVYYRATGASSLSHIGRSEKKVDAQWRSMLLHMKYLRSLEDSDRVHRACVTYMQNWLIHFYPERPDIVSEADGLAAALGGQLERPRLSWKYSWIEGLFGWPLAKRVQDKARNFRWAMQRSLDRALFNLESRGNTGLTGA